MTVLCNCYWGYLYQNNLKNLVFATFRDCFHWKIDCFLKTMFNNLVFRLDSSMFCSWFSLKVGNSLFKKGVILFQVIFLEFDDWRIMNAVFKQWRDIRDNKWWAVNYLVGQKSIDYWLIISWSPNASYLGNLKKLGLIKKLWILIKIISGWRQCGILNFMKVSFTGVSIHGFTHPTVVYGNASFIGSSQCRWQQFWSWNPSNFDLFFKTPAVFFIPTKAGANVLRNHPLTAPLF